jgi:hypothetical protein
MGHSKKGRDYTESNAWQTTFGCNMVLLQKKVHEMR